MKQYNESADSKNKALEFAVHQGAQVQLHNQVASMKKEKRQLQKDLAAEYDNCNRKAKQKMKEFSKAYDPVTQTMKRNSDDGALSTDSDSDDSDREFSQESLLRDIANLDHNIKIVAKQEAAASKKVNSYLEVGPQVGPQAKKARN